MRRKTFTFGAIVIFVVASVAWLLYMSTLRRDILPERDPAALAPKTTSGSNPLPQQQAGMESPTRPDPIEGTISLTGRVFTKRLVPISGARVETRLSTTTSAQPPEESRVLLTTSTDTSGRYSLLSIQRQPNLVVVASCDGYVPSERVVALDTSHPKSLDFYLTPEGSVAGLVESMDGKPLAGMVILAKGDDGYVGRSSPTRQDGAFQIEEMDGGMVSLWATLADPQGQLGLPKAGPLIDESSQPKIQLRKGEHREGIRIRIPWDREATITGIVLAEDGQGLPDTAVTALAPGGSLLSATTSGQEGEFRLENLVSPNPNEPDIAVTVCFALPGYESQRLKDIAIRSDNLRVVMKPLQAGRITGEVLDRKERTAVANAQVCVFGGTTADGRSLSPDYSAIRQLTQSGGTGVDSGGQFVIENVTAGFVSLFVYAPGYGMSVLSDIQVTAGQDTEVTVLLEPAGILRVNVRYTANLEGKRAACQIFCKPDGTNDWSSGVGPITESLFTGQTQEDEAGDGMASSRTYEIALSPGRYQVSVMTEISTRAFYPFSAEVYSGETTDLDAPVGGIGVVQGTVPPLPDERRSFVVLVPGTGFSADLETSAGDMYAVLRYTNGQAAFAPAWPSYEIDGLAPGTYTIGAFTVNRTDGHIVERGSGTVQVTGSDPITLDFP